MLAGVNYVITKQITSNGEIKPYSRNRFFHILSNDIQELANVHAEGGEYLAYAFPVNVHNMNGTVVVADAIQETHFNLDGSDAGFNRII